jgi:hypothetical protein
VKLHFKGLAAYHVADKVMLRAENHVPVNNAWQPWKEFESEQGLDHGWTEELKREQPIVIQGKSLPRAEIRVHMHQRQET